MPPLLASSTYSATCTTARNDLGVVYSSLDGTQLAVVDGVCVCVCVCVYARACVVRERGEDFCACTCVHMCMFVCVIAL
jgi:hypothetical protein